MTNVTVSGNSATRGGGLFSNGKSTLENVTVSGNSAKDGGGVYSGGQSITLVNVTVSGNSASQSGGGLENESGTTSLTNTIVAGNTGGDVGGNAVSSTYSLIGGSPLLAPLGDYGGPTLTMPPLPRSLAIDGGTTAGAPAFDQRGFALGDKVDIGAVQLQGASTLVVTATGDAGAQEGEFDLRGAVNEANIQSGAQTITFAPSVFSTSQTITLTGGQLVLSNPASTTITGPGANLLSVSGNHASRVFDVNGGSTSISGLKITGGSATGGGGLYNSTNLSLSNVTIGGNSALSGGGLFNKGTVWLTDVTISNNSAVGAGGLFSDGPASLTNVTVSGNSASQFGGGLYNYLSNMSLTNVTVSGNTATRGGGGLETYLGTTSLSNTIVAGNTGGDVGGNAVSSTNSLIGGSPLLAPLGNYGGPTQTMALLPGSPAIGGGRTTGAPGTDQRGVARSGREDIGAFQSQGFVVTITGGNNQTTPVGTAFPTPLQVTVTSTHGEPVAGGVVSFTDPTTGASATLSGNSAVIAGNGTASVDATANATAGSYTVSASTGLGSANFGLTNSAAQGSSQVAKSMTSSGAAAVQLADANDTITPGTIGDDVSTGEAGETVLASTVPSSRPGSGTVGLTLDEAGGSIRPADVLEGSGDSPRRIVILRQASASPAASTRLKLIFDTIE
jgi:fibronectin-binding autotransporter adhesin